MTPPAVRWTPAKRAKIRQPPVRLRAVSLFSGAGGFCEGVQLAGYEVLCGVEADPHACRTHAANFPDVPLFRGDVERFLIDDLAGTPTREELVGAGIDLVYGGPP